jgi:hypothetical protein
MIGFTSNGAKNALLFWHLRIALRRSSSRVLNDGKRASILTTVPISNGTPMLTIAPAHPRTRTHHQTQAERARCEKRHFWRHLYIKTNILPRQARDKHRENSKKSGENSKKHVRTGESQSGCLSRQARDKPIKKGGRKSRLCVPKYSAILVYYDELRDHMCITYRTGFPCVVVALGRVRAEEARHGPHLRQNTSSLLGASLCLSRARLGNVIVFSIK